MVKGKRRRTSFHLSLFAFRLFLCLSVLVAQFLIVFMVHADSQTIKSIDFEGNIRTPSATISQKLISHVGTSLNKESIRRDIRELYKLGQFEDIKVDATPDHDGVHLKYIFVEKPVIAAIGFQGNRKLKDDELKKEISMKTYSPLDDMDLSASMEKIRQAYAKKGYYLARVSYHIETTEAGEAKLIFDVQENQGRGKARRLPDVRRQRDVLFRFLRRRPRLASISL